MEVALYSTLARRASGSSSGLKRDRLTAELKKGSTRDTPKLVGGFWQVTGAKPYVAALR